MSRYSPDDYVEHITSFHVGRPNFVATVAITVLPLADIQVGIAGIPAAFDLDVAVGVQLDVVGQWIGRSRQIPVPIEGIYFSFDDANLERGFDRGVWKGPYSTGIALSLLDDDTYRRLLRAKILANNWDGTVSTLQAILDTYFIDPESHVFVVDMGYGIGAVNYFSFDDPSRGFDIGVWEPLGRDGTYNELDMYFTVGVTGKRPSILDLFILSQGLLLPTPAAVRVDYEIASVDGTALFGFDVENDRVAGFDVGTWGVSPDYIVEHS